MTELYARVPLWLSLDGGVRTLPAPARLALYELAVNGGAARCGEDPSAVLDGLCAGAGGLLDVMLDRGVVAVEDGRIVLVAPNGAPSRIGDTSATPPEAGEAPLPHGDDRGPVKRLCALWSKAGAETREARAAWVDSPAGVRFLAREGRDRTWALDRAGRSHGVNSGRFGRRQPVNPAASTSSTVDTADGVNPGVNPSPSPAPPPSGKNEEGSGSGARAHGVNPNTNHGVNPDTASGVSPASTSPRLPTVERPGAIGAADVLFELRGAKLTLSASPTHIAELDRALVAVTPAWTLASVRRLAGHIRAGHLGNGWRPSLDALRGRDASWTKLLSLHDEAVDCERCGTKRLREDDLPPPPPPVDPATLPPPLTPEQVRASRPAFFRNRPDAPAGAPDAK